LDNAHDETLQVADAWQQRPIAPFISTRFSREQIVDCRLRSGVPAILPTVGATLTLAPQTAQNEMKSSF
jgi:hypothetical protein